MAELPSTNDMDHENPKVDLREPKTKGAWVDLYNTLAGKEIFTLQEGGEDPEKLLTFNEFRINDKRSTIYNVADVRLVTAVGKIIENS